MLVADGPSPLHDALAELGLLLVEDDPHTRMLLMATEEPPLFEFLQGRREIRRAEQVFVLPALVDEAALEPLERRLLHRTEELLRARGGGPPARPPHPARAELGAVEGQRGEPAVGADRRLRRHGSGPHATCWP